jgi:predicted DNA binding CopG/RHH family protein
MLQELQSKAFASEAEEAAWWESHEDELADEFEKATAEGRAGYGTVVITGDSTLAKIDLDPEDIAKARVQAAERGLRYQTYLKMIIHEALRDAESNRKTAAP